MANDIKFKSLPLAAPLHPLREKHTVDVPLELPILEDTGEESPPLSLGTRGIEVESAEDGLQGGRLGAGQLDELAELFDLVSESSLVEGGLYLGRLVLLGGLAGELLAALVALEHGSGVMLPAEF